VDGGERGAQLVGDVGHELRAYLLEPPELGDVVQHHDDAGIIGGQPQRHRIGLDGALEGPGHAQLASDDGALAAQPAPADQLVQSDVADDLEQRRALGPRRLRPNIVRARSFISTTWPRPSTASTPSTMPSRIAPILARSCWRSASRSRSRWASVLMARASTPISSGERTGARAAKLPSLISRAIVCIWTTGSVTRPATNMPMPSATTSATSP